jgi:Dolichyl-phosphate-mannose-protein mannosyltransferase
VGPKSQEMKSAFLSNDESCFEQSDVSLPKGAPRSRREVILPWALKAFFWSFGILILVWAIRDSRFRDAEGFINGTFCLPTALGITLLMLGTAVTTPLRRTALWCALAIVGQAVALQLIEAGPLIHYQHYKPLHRLFAETNPLLLAYLAVQIGFVAGGLRSHLVDIRAWVGRTFKLWQLAGVVLIFAFSSAALSREVSTYVVELLFATFVQAVNLGNILLLAWSLPEEHLVWFKKRTQSLAESYRYSGVTSRARLDRFAVVAAIWVTMLAATLSYFSYERHPHVPDEVIYLQHARYLARGTLTIPAPPVPAAFNIYLMEIEGNRWYAVPPPGWPLVLAMSTLIGAAWLVNPVLAGLNVLLAFSLTQEMFDRRVARWVALLLCVSPWYVFMAMNFMTHTVTLTCALIAALGVVWARKTNHARWAGIAGGAIGLASLIRPLEGLILAALLGLWAIGIGGRRLKLTSIASLILSTTVIGALVLPYNKLLTGNATAQPIMVYTDKHFGVGSNAFGFGPQRGMGWALDPFPGHGPLDAAVNANLNIFSLNIELFGWSAGSLILISLLIFSGGLRRGDYPMLVVIAAIFGLHCFYYYSGGPDFGARYWFLMIVPCAVLTVRGIQHLEGVFGSEPSGSGQKSVRVTVAVLALCALTLVNYFPWRAVDKYRHYLRMRPDVRYLAKEFDFGRSLILIRGNEHPDYVSAFAYNQLDLQADAPVYAWDRSPAITAQVLRTYSDRPVWIINGPSITQRGYEIVSGPLPAASLLASENESH